MQYEDLKDMDLKEYQVPMRLSKKLFAYAQWEENHDDYSTKTLLECAQHALALEEQLAKTKEAENEEQETRSAAPIPPSAEQTH